MYGHMMATKGRKVARRQRRREKIKMWHQGLGHVGGEPTGRDRCVSIGGASLGLSQCSL